MRSKSKSVLRTALIYIGIFICGAVLVVLLLSFFDNTLNGTLREWFYRGYMTEYYDSEMATDYVEPDWNAIKGLAFRLALTVFAFCVIVIGVVSRLRLNAERRRIAARYLAEMHNPAVTLPAELPDCTHVWHIFAVRCADRDALEKHLNARGIGTNKHYPTPIHLQGAYAELGLGRGALPLAEEISATELSLPMFYGMTDAQVQAVIDAVNEFEG